MYQYWNSKAKEKRNFLFFKMHVWKVVCITKYYRILHLQYFVSLLKKTKVKVRNFYLGDLRTHSCSLLMNTKCNMVWFLNTSFRPSPVLSDVASKDFYLIAIQRSLGFFISFGNPQSVYGWKLLSRSIGNWGLLS